MNDLTNIGNLVEAGLWAVIALVMCVKALRGDLRFRRLFFVLAVAFVLFGISDLIESRTGAWWRPWWLFVLKAACVAVFLFGFRKYYHINKAYRDEQHRASADGNDARSRTNERI